MGSQSKSHPFKVLKAPSTHSIIAPITNFFVNNVLFIFLSKVASRDLGFLIEFCILSVSHRDWIRVDFMK